MHSIPSCLHRERKPIRTCTECNAYLSTGNLTTTCWACDPVWDFERPKMYMTTYVRDEIGDALERMMAVAA